MKGDERGPNESRVSFMAIYSSTNDKHWLCQTTIFWALETSKQNSVLQAVFLTVQTLRSDEM